MADIGTVALMLLLGVTSSYGASNSYLTPLANYIKRRSDPDVAPIQAHGTPLQLSMLYVTLNIASADLETNVVEFENIVGLKWNTGISWDPAEYGGAEDIILPIKYFWTPPTQVITTAVKGVNLAPQHLHLYHNGTVSFYGMYRYKLLCDVSNIEVKAECKSKVTMWGYSKDQVNAYILPPPRNRPSRYFADSKYQLLSGGMKMTEMEFDGKSFQIMNSLVTFREKPQSDRRYYGGMKAFFQWR